MDLMAGASAMDRLAVKVSELAHPPEGAMEAVLERARAIIQERTLNSTDKNGISFTPYSTSKFYVSKDSEYYNVALAAGGRTVRSDNGKEIKGVIFDGGYKQFKEQSGNPSTPNLKVLWIMLDQVGSRVDSPELGWIVMGDALERDRIGAAHEHGTGAVPQRPWWGVGLIQEEYDQLLAIVRAKYAEAINSIYVGGW